MIHMTKNCYDRWPQDKFFILFLLLFCDFKKFFQCQRFRLSDLQVLFRLESEIIGDDTGGLIVNLFIDCRHDFIAQKLGNDGRNGNTQQFRKFLYGNRGRNLYNLKRRLLISHRFSLFFMLYFRDFFWCCNRDGALLFLRKFIVLRFALRDRLRIYARAFSRMERRDYEPGIRGIQECDGEALVTAEILERIETYDADLVDALLRQMMDRV